MSVHPRLAKAYDEFRTGRLRHAEVSLQTYLRSAPSDPDAIKLLSIIQSEQGQHAAAVFNAQRALNLRPDDAELVWNLGEAVLRHDRPLEAEDHFRRALELNPQHTEAHLQLGRLLWLRGEARRGLEHSSHAAALTPGRDETVNEFVANLCDVGRAQETIEPLVKLLTLQDGAVSMVSSLIANLNYTDTLTPAEIFEEQRRLGRALSSRVRRDGYAPTNTPDPDRPLVIGLISGDLRHHPVARFLLRWLGRLDRSMYQLHALNCGPVDATSERLRPLFTQWTDIEQIMDEPLRDTLRGTIDVLIDLQGHTKRSRLGPLVMRTAPVQATYLGYPASTCMDNVDWRLVDPLTDPPGSAEALHTERLARLDRCFLCFEAPDDAPAPALRTVPGEVVFGCMNTPNKVTRSCVGVWARVMGAVPGSRMVVNTMLKDTSLVSERLGPWFAQAGIDPVRIIWRAISEHQGSFLDEYSGIDVALDCWPYNGTTTTCEALYMGVPTVVLAGDAHVSRVGVSILHAAGLDELIAPGPDEFVRLASELARDRARLERYRRELRGRLESSSLMDGSAMARSFEACVRRMWRDWCAGHPPLTPNP